jgi:peptide/nickel transport system substrate-binding protein
MMPASSLPSITLRLLILGVLAACAEGAAARDDLLDDDVSDAERYGGTLVLGIPSDITDVNPLTRQTAVAGDIIQHVLQLPLVGYDEQLQPVPRLARSWEFDEAAGTLTFRLRDDVFWHDGVQTTAYDMQFAYERARNPVTAYPGLPMLQPYGEAEVVDSFTWRVRTQPHAEFLDAWTILPPLPRHLLEAVPAEALGRHPSSPSAPVGNGPFRFVERRPGERWIFEANSDFPAELGGLPYLNRVVFRIVPEATTRLTELLTGGIDFYTRVSPAQAARVASSRGVGLLRSPGISYSILGFNQRREPFGDVRVRRALTLAIDREAIRTSVFDGYASLANTTISPFFPHHDAASGSDLGHDPERARALLAEAGFRDRNGDGVLEDENGTPLRFTILHSVAADVAHDAGVVIQSDLRRIGVDAQLQAVEFNTLVARLREPADFEAVLLGYVPAFRNNDAIRFGCHARNVSFGHCSPETDALLERVLAIPDREAAQPLWSEYQRRLAEELPVTFLLFPDILHGASTRLRDARPDARGAWVGIERWWIHPARR